jgi:hypothetical protein
MTSCPCVNRPAVRPPPCTPVVGTRPIEGPDSGTRSGAATPAGPGGCPPMLPSRRCRCRKRRCSLALIQAFTSATPTPVAAGTHLDVTATPLQAASPNRHQTRHHSTLPSPNRSVRARYSPFRQVAGPVPPKGGADRQLAGTPRRRRSTRHSVDGIPRSPARPEMVNISFRSLRRALPHRLRGRGVDDADSRATANPASDASTRPRMTPRICR